MARAAAAQKRSSRAREVVAAEARQCRVVLVSESVYAAVGETVNTNRSTPLRAAQKVARAAECVLAHEMLRVGMRAKYAHCRGRRHGIEERHGAAW